MLVHWSQSPAEVALYAECDGWLNMYVNTGNYI